MALVCDARDQIEHPLHIRATEIDRKEDDFKSLLVRVRGRFNGKVNGLFERPAVGVLDDVFARGHLHHDAGHAAIDGPLHIVDHASGERENLRTEVPLHDLLDRRFVAGRHHGHSGFDPMNAGCRQALGDPDLFILGEDDSRLLFPVAQSDVVKFNLLGEMQLALNGWFIVPRAGEPLFCLPRLI